MGAYPFEDWGLVIPQKDMEKVIANYFCISEEEIKNDIIDIVDYAWKLFDDIPGHIISEFYGTANKILESGKVDWDDFIEYDGDILYYIEMKNFPNLFKQAYKDMKELINEFKEIIGEYIPEDFDYREHICHIIGNQYV